MVVCLERLRTFLGHRPLVIFRSRHLIPVVAEQIALSCAGAILAPGKPGLGAQASDLAQLVGVCSASGVLAYTCLHRREFKFIHFDPFHKVTVAHVLLNW